MNIPLYNCYWCKCAWCVLGNICEEKKCYQCRQIDKKGKVPYLKESCFKWIPKTTENKRLIDEIQKCRRCKYKRVVRYIKEQLEGKNL